MPAFAPDQPPAIVIINTGGTLNKRYDPLTGHLRVPSDEQALVPLLESAAPNLALHIQGLIHKDSLEMTDEDRQLIAATIHALPDSLQSAPVIIVHGTDTLHQTALALDAANLNRPVILTGAMRPAELDPRESALHLGLALGFIAAGPLPGIYIAMHGRVLPFAQLIKNQRLGVFQPVSTPR